MSSSVASVADMSASVTTLSEARTLLYVFEVSLEIREDEGKVISINGKIRTKSNCLLFEGNVPSSL